MNELNGKVMLKLRYSLKRDPHQHATVFGDPEAIRDLYWQLTHNYDPKDGRAIGSVHVLNTDGVDVTSEVLTNPFAACSVTTMKLN